MIPFKVHPLPTYRIGAVSDGGTHKGKKAKKSMFRCKMFDKTRTSIFDLICMSSETSVRSLSDSSRLIVLRMIAAFVVRRFADFSTFSSLTTLNLCRTWIASFCRFDFDVGRLSFHDATDAKRNDSWPDFSCRRRHHPCAKSWIWSVVNVIKHFFAGNLDVKTITLQNTLHRKGMAAV